MDKIFQGVIYILTNPSFPEYVKIGYAKDVRKRVKNLNASSKLRCCVLANPFTISVYFICKINGSAFTTFHSPQKADIAL